jgi:CRISPR-associated endoribonuclease Cas6
MIFLDVRSIRENFCSSLLKALGSNIVLRLFNKPMVIHSVEWHDRTLATSTLNIKMLSPLTVHKTEDAKTYYYTPLDNDFAEAINQNFIRKYTAFAGEAPTNGIKISPIHVGARDKYVTTFKGTHITGWRGEYKLSGSPEYLNFLYYCGLGARNSNGFGMFELRDIKLR